MAGSVVVRSNFVLNEVNVGDDVVLSTVEGTGLDCGVNVALCHCNTDAAHSVHHRDAGVRTHNADLHAGELFGSGDSLVTGVEVTCAEGVSGENDEAVVTGGGEQVVQLAGLENLLLVLDAVVNVRSAEYSEVRNVGLDDGVCNEGHVESVHSALLEGLLLVAELSIGINFDGVTAFGGVIQIVAELLKGLCFRILDGLVECALQNGLADLCAVGCCGVSRSCIGSSGGVCCGSAGSRRCGLAACAQCEYHAQCEEHCENRFDVFHYLSSIMNFIYRQISLPVTQIKSCVRGGVKIPLTVTTFSTGFSKNISVSSR